MWTIFPQMCTFSFAFNLKFLHMKESSSMAIVRGSKINWQKKFGSWLILHNSNINFLQNDKVQQGEKLRWLKNLSFFKRNLEIFWRFIFSFMILFPQRSPSECPVTLQDMECSWGWRAVVRPKHTLNFVLCNLALTLDVFFTVYPHYTWSAIWTFHFSCMTLLVYAETLVHGTLFYPGNFLCKKIFGA